jgi:hypothetical protein
VSYHDLLSPNQEISTKFTDFIFWCKNAENSEKLTKTQQENKNSAELSPPRVQLILLFNRGILMKVSVPIIFKFAGDSISNTITPDYADEISSIYIQTCIFHMNI